MAVEPIHIIVVGMDTLESGRDEALTDLSEHEASGEASEALIPAGQLEATSLAKATESARVRCGNCVATCFRAQESALKASCLRPSKRKERS